MLLIGPMIYSLILNKTRIDPMVPILVTKENGPPVNFQKKRKRKLWFICDRYVIPSNSSQPSPQDKTKKTSKRQNLKSPDT